VKFWNWREMFFLGAQSLSHPFAAIAIHTRVQERMHGLEGVWNATVLESRHAITRVVRRAMCVVSRCNRRSVRPAVGDNLLCHFAGPL
jgi:hypothetical protein